MEYLFTVLEKNLEDILRIAHASFNEFYSRDKLLERLEGRKYWTQIAKEEGKIVGFKIWYEDDDKEIYSWLGAVLPAYRRRGIATHMFEIQFDLARALKYSKVKLKTHEGHPEMIALCRKLGFVEIGRDPNHWGEGLEAIFLEYNLKKSQSINL